MPIIKFNNEFLDIPCKRDKTIMVGSISCGECEYNNGTSLICLDKKNGNTYSLSCRFDDDSICEKEIIYWSCNQFQEKLSCISKDEAIEYYLDDIEEGKEPETVKVYGFARQEVSDNEDGIGILEDFLANLDENYGDPDGDCTEMTDSMKKAAKVFVDTVISEYEIWTCDCVYEEEVDLKKWIEKNERKI